MRVTITSDDLQSIKDYLHASLPDRRPSHRLEAAARAFGFTTYAGLREALAAGPVTLEADDLRFCSELALAFETEKDFQRHLSRSIARIALHRILDDHPMLTQRGFDSAWLGNSRETALPRNARPFSPNGAARPTSRIGGSISSSWHGSISRVRKRSDPSISRSAATD
jgi:hypothetical protein